MKDNLIGSTPRIVREDTLLLKTERDPKRFSDEAEIVGPNEAANNRVAAKKDRRKNRYRAKNKLP